MVTPDGFSQITGTSTTHKTPPPTCSSEAPTPGTLMAVTQGSLPPGFLPTEVLERTALEPWP